MKRQGLPVERGLFTGSDLVVELAQEVYGLGCHDLPVATAITRRPKLYPRENLVVSR